MLTGDALTFEVITFRKKIGDTKCLPEGKRLVCLCSVKQLEERVKWGTFVIAESLIQHTMN